MRALPLMLGIALLAQIPAPAMACGPAGRPSIPPLAAVIDSELPQAALAEADRKTLVALRERIRTLADAGKESSARQVEEKAMRVLGYEKLWLRCGPGTFLWGRIAPPARGS